MEDAMHVEGYASLFNIPDLSGDVVAPGAFAESLSEWPASRLPMLLQHDPAVRVGEWLTAKEDGVGLWVEGHLSFDRGVADLVCRGFLRGLSIGFRTRKYDPRPDGGRLLRKIALREVSLVSHPMHPNARLWTVRGQAAA